MLKRFTLSLAAIQAIYGKQVTLVGGISTHEHTRDFDSQKHKMTVMQAAIEAKNSGYAVLCVMPNTSPAITNMETLKEYHKLTKAAEKATGIVINIYAGLTDNNFDEVIDMLSEPYTCGIKVYPNGVTTGDAGSGISSWEILHDFLTYAKSIKANSVNNIIAAHWENPRVKKLPSFNEGEQETVLEEIERNNDTSDLKHFLNLEKLSDIASLQNKEDKIYAIEILAEYIALQKAVEFAKEFPEFNFIACHLSSGLGCNLIEKFWNEGHRNIATEVAPHHARFNREMKGVNINGIQKCFPAIKKPIDQEMLLVFIKRNHTNGLIFIANDSAPHTKEEKSGENPMAGIACQQHAIPVFISLSDKLGLDYISLQDLLTWNAYTYMGFNEDIKDLCLQNSSTWSIESYIDNNEKKYNNGVVPNAFKGFEMIGKKVA